MISKMNAKKQPQIPESIARFIDTVCERQKQYGNAIRPPHMLVPLSSGNGRSHIAQAVARQYRKANVLKFSTNADICLDFTVKETVHCMNQIYADIQANSGCSNEFCGIVALAIDSLLSHLREMSGNKFFELVTKIKGNSSLIIFTPADISQKYLELILEKTGAGVKLFAPITYSDEDFAKFFCDFLPQGVEPTKSVSTLQLNRRRVSAYISTNIRNKTIKSIKEAAEAVFYDDEAMAELFGKKDIYDEIRGVPL